jgi:hypothetical protein
MGSKRNGKPKGQKMISEIIRLREAGLSIRAVARASCFELKDTQKGVDNLAGCVFHSKELSPMLSLYRNLSRGSIISWYWSLRRLTHLGSNLPGQRPTRHCDMQRRNRRMHSSGYKMEKHAKSQLDRMN